MVLEKAQAAAIATQPQTAAAELREVSKVYGAFAALRNVSTSFEMGSCTMILGENGAGKSTLLRMVAGLISPSRGSVATFGTTPQEQRGRIAYMSHAPMLYDELSAGENLRYFAGLRGDGCGLCTGSPEMALRAVGLDPHLKRPVGQYSQGMRQRTSLARVLQSDPELLLLDEPFSNLDVESAEMMVTLLADFRTWPITSGPMAGIGRRTIILTTHQAHLGAPIADTTLTMRAGKIASVLKREPAI
ncbi:ABC-type multidrug transport system ATPase subunit [Granulicella aggregans]|uniref:ABC-type multidrug transport system ATPase subunit n=2 Tax=Granulicella aggregans TaxID=474949 RepID=A0A7W7ZAC8_9BACT|nr:ABC transporter ATP-binding protein [Granulicella aggregans]MBB5056143.1 ABC-type multidrug transport system ATPase subunit [Granulicella aggregans]